MDINEQVGTVFYPLLKQIIIFNHVYQGSLKCPNYLYLLINTNIVYFPYPTISPQRQCFGVLVP